MILFPYKVDVDLGRLPVMTLIVCAICVWVFARQQISESQFRSALDNYCSQQITRDEQLVMRYLHVPAETHLCGVLLEIRDAPDKRAAISKLADASRQTPFYKDPKDSRDYVYSKLLESSLRFERAVPGNLTDRLAYAPGDLNVWRMLTATFSHADWWHVISNLIFFFAFAASVEIIAGYAFYSGFILFAAIGTSLAYSYSEMETLGAVPTVGLSGVVMAMTAFLATIAPTLRIRSLFWFFLFVRVFRVPALAIAAFYILQDIFYYLQHDPESQVNYVAHISGAAIGVILGIVYRFTHREYLRDLVPQT
jgi:membrane associated rhomboid family serine protease